MKDLTRVLAMRKEIAELFRLDITKLFPSEIAFASLLKKEKAKN